MPGVVVGWRMRGVTRVFGVGMMIVGCAPGGQGGPSSGTGTTATSSGTTGTSTATATSGVASGTSAGPTGATSGPGLDVAPGDPLLAPFLTIAHRGGAMLRPEETLQAFEHALAVGAEVIEFDVHASKDGVVVAIHDDTVDRTTEGVGPVKDMTLAELQALDAGYRFSTDGGQSFPYRGQGLKIPTLEEILAAFPDTLYLIEIKQADPPIVDVVLDSLSAHGVLGRVVLASFNPETILAVRAAAPEVHTALSLPEMVDLNARLDDPTYVPPARFVQAPWESTSQAVVDFAHMHGMVVHPWTVDDEATMKLMIGRGVDGIMSDDPALLASLDPG